MIFGYFFNAQMFQTWNLRSRRKELPPITTLFHLSNSSKQDHKGEMEILRTFRMIPDVFPEAVLNHQWYAFHDHWKESWVILLVIPRFRCLIIDLSSKFLIPLMIILIRSYFDIFRSYDWQTPFFQWDPVLLIMYYPLLHVESMLIPWGSNQVWSPAALLLCTFLAKNSHPWGTNTLKLQPPIHNKCTKTRVAVVGSSNINLT